MTLAEHTIECTARYNKLASDIATNRRQNSARHKQNVKTLSEINAKLDNMVPKKWLMRGIYAALAALVATIGWLIDHIWPFIKIGWK